MKTNFNICCESAETMAQIIDIMKCGWTKEQIINWLKQPFAEKEENLKDAVECMEQHTPKKLILKCDGCKNNDVECMHCMRAYSDCYEN